MLIGLRDVGVCFEASVAERRKKNCSAEVRFFMMGKRQWPVFSENDTGF